MSNVKRYSPGITMTSEVGLPGYYAPVLTLDEHGPAVMYDDYAALQSKLSAVQAGADRLREAVQRWADYMHGSDKGIEAINLEGLPRWVGAVDEEAQLLDALAAYQAGTGAVDAWRPIAEAPKDGTLLDLWVDSGQGITWRWTDVRWIDGDWCHRAKDHRHYLASYETPTHYMPLPEPPKEKP